MSGADADLGWTATPPSREGWWWYHDGHEARPVRVYLSDDYDPPQLMAEHGDWFEAVAELTGQWGPLPLVPPSERVYVVNEGEQGR